MTSKNQTFEEPTTEGYRTNTVPVNDLRELIEDCDDFLPKGVASNLVAGSQYQFQEDGSYALTPDETFLLELPEANTYDSHVIARNMYFKTD